MTRIDSTPAPTALDLADALERGRLERSRAFRAGLAALRGWVEGAVQHALSGGKPQVRH